MITDQDRAYFDQLVCAGIHPVKYLTAELVDLIHREGIPGHFAECGVMAGAHPAVMSYMLDKFGDSVRKIYMFDSFSGIPAAGPNDYPSAAALEGKSAVDLPGMKMYMRQWNVNPHRLVYQPGLFENTMATYADTLAPLALLRVDVDLYSSTKTVYDHLYSKVVPNGVIIDDDWGPEGDPTPCRQAVLDSLAAQGIPAPQVTRFPQQPTTVWWRK